MKFAVLDFETYYADDYTLSKMTTEAYVRDPRYKTHCIGIKTMDSLPPVGTTQAQPTMTLDHNGFLLIKHKVLDYAVVCHNAAFDGLILSHHYGVTPAFWFDTLSMARLVFPHDKSISLESLAHKFGLPPKSVPYNAFRGVRDAGTVPGLYGELTRGCAHDVELTYIIFRKLLPLVPREELKLIDITIRMFTEPRLELDRPRMEAYYEKVKIDKQTVLDRLGVTKEMLQSSEIFAGILRRLGVEPPVKASPKHPDKSIYAFAKTDEAFKELCADENPLVADLCSARLGQKSTLNETRCQSLLGMYGRGRLTVPLRYYGAVTGRWSGQDGVNFQNFPRSGEIRECLLAPPQYVLLVGDLSQIECRMLNWLAGEQWVLQAFREGRDLYSEGATKYYGRLITKANLPERGFGKQLELSCGFGSGGPKIVITAKRGIYGPSLDLTQEEGMRARDLYRQTHPNVVTLWKTGVTMLEHLFRGSQTQWGPMEIRDHKVYLPNGSWLDYTNLVYKGAGKNGRSEFAVATRKGEARIYGSKFIQNVIEALSRLVLVKAICEIQPHYPLVMCTHDEGVWCVPEKEAAAVLPEVLKTMRTPLPWCPDIPLDAEGSYDVRYAK